MILYKILYFFKNLIFTAKIELIKYNGYNINFFNRVKSINSASSGLSPTSGIN